jgi:hypothetical protein
MSQFSSVLFWFDKKWFCLTYAYRLFCVVCKERKKVFYFVNSIKFLCVILFHLNNNFSLSKENKKFFLFGWYFDSSSSLFIHSSFFPFLHIFFIHIFALIISNGHSPANLSNSSTRRKFANFGEFEYSPKWPFSDIFQTRQTRIRQTVTLRSTRQTRIRQNCGDFGKFGKFGEFGEFGEFMENKVDHLEHTK